MMQQVMLIIRMFSSIAVCSCTFLQVVLFLFHYCSLFFKLTFKTKVITCSMNLIPDEENQAETLKTQL